VAVNVSVQGVAWSTVWANPGCEEFCPVSWGCWGWVEIENQGGNWI